MLATMSAIDAARTNSVDMIHGLLYQVVTMLGHRVGVQRRR